MLLSPDCIGTLAAVCTTLAYVPQAAKVLKTRETHAISLVMYIVMTTGIALWVAFGLMIGSLPVIIGNGITLALTILILLMKIRYR